MRLPAFPAADHERLENPPLQAMLGQLQFPPMLRLQKGVPEIADFQEAIRHLLPGFAVEQQIQIIVSPAGEATTTTNGAYRFTNETRTWSALLSPTALTLEAVAGGRYSSFSEFASLFQEVWAAAVEHLRPAQITQQGLRYVDHLEGDRTPSEWSTWINPTLLGGLTSAALGTGLDQTVSELVYQLEDGRIVFRHGIVRAGPQSAKGYLLDVDSVHTATLEPGDRGAVMARFEESHDLIYRFFRWCVTEHALEAFRHAGS